MGIEGNEIVDRAANLGHNNDFSALSNLNNIECMRSLKTSFFQLWKRTWKDKVILTQKGKFLSSILAEPIYRPWLSTNPRILETVSARIRIGHVGVQNHMYRFEMSEDRFCTECGVPETIEHFLLNCEKHHDIRQEMQGSPTSLGVQLCMKNLLLGGCFDENIQKKIHFCVMKFVRKSGMIYSL